MNRDEQEIIAEAADWHVASARDDMDWDGFTDWLEADPRHRAAYDEVALADALLEEHRDTLRQVPAAFENAPAPLRPRRRTWMGLATAALAASLVAIVAGPQFLASDERSYVTAASSRSITLTDGSTVLLAPHSRLVLDGEDRVDLAGGGWFDVRHDPSRALAIRAGDITVTDIGTQFDIQATGKQVRVEVADGAVEVTSAALPKPVRLTRERRLLYDARGRTAVVSPISPEAIGAWREGRLTYEATPLALVAADLSRYAAIRVVVPDSLRNRTFSGTLVIGDGKRAISDLSQLMGLELRSGADGFRLDEPRR